MEECLSPGLCSLHAGLCAYRRRCLQNEWASASILGCAAKNVFFMCILGEGGTACMLTCLHGEGWDVCKLHEGVSQSWALQQRTVARVDCILGGWGHCLHAHLCASREDVANLHGQVALSCEAEI